MRSSDGLSLALTVGLAVGLRLVGLDRKSVWFDEAVTSFTARIEWTQFLESISHDVHPPLSYALYHLWPWVGAGDFLLRLPSAVLGGLAAWPAWGWARRIGSPLVALLTGLFVAVAPLQVDLAQEARMYGLLLLLTATSLWLLDRLLVTPTTPRVLAYALVATAMLYAHYYGALLLAAEGTAALLAFSSLNIRDRMAGPGVRGAMMALLGLAVAGLAFVPWLPVLAAQAVAIQGDYWIEIPRATTLWVTFRDLAAHTPPDEPFRFVLRVAYVLVAALLALGGVLAARDARQRVALCLLIVPVGLALAISLLVAPVYAVRYVSPIGLGFAFLLARGVGAVASLGRGLGVIAAAVAFLPALVSLGPMYLDPGYSRADLRAAAHEIERRRQVNEIVLHLGNFTAAPFDYYMVAPPSRVLETNARTELCDALRAARGGWLVTAYTPDDPDAREAVETGIIAPGYAGDLVTAEPLRVLGVSALHLQGGCGV